MTTFSCDQKIDLGGHRGHKVTQFTVVGVLDAAVDVGDQQGQGHSKDEGQNNSKGDDPAFVCR